MWALPVGAAGEAVRNGATADAVRTAPETGWGFKAAEVFPAPGCVTLVLAAGEAFEFAAGCEGSVGPGGDVCMVLAPTGVETCAVTWGELVPTEVWVEAMGVLTVAEALALTGDVPDCPVAPTFAVPTGVPAEALTRPDPAETCAETAVPDPEVPGAGTVVETDPPAAGAGAAGTAGAEALGAEGGEAATGAAGDAGAETPVLGTPGTGAETGTEALTWTGGADGTDGTPTPAAATRLACEKSRASAARARTTNRIPSRKIACLDAVGKSVGRISNHVTPYDLLLEKQKSCQVGTRL